MGRTVAFNVTCMGASHVKSGKPCQDYSLSWQSDDGAVHVAIVCDGHGGDTYVRSDRGSRLAAETALRNIRNVVECVPPDIFLDTEGAVTARPEDEEDIFHTRQKQAVDTSGYGEEDIRRQLTEQHQRFREAVEPIRKQDMFMQRLFAGICLQWTAAIEEDARNNPFTDAENEKLKGARIAKAYGTTLMAYVRTPLYWFAFHIGDGKMLACDTAFRWREPVPWDCNCFLNITTSLCDREPLHSFRYAFSGKGDFPAAVIMGSDGLDDSWCTMPNLENFYSHVLNTFDEMKEEETLKQLNDYLPHLSERGSRDDMSMAGIIDMDAIADGAARYRKQREINALLGEKRRKEESIAELQKSLAATERQLHEAQNAYDKWSDEADRQRTELEAGCDMLAEAGRRFEEESRSAWAMQRERYLAEREKNRQQELSDKVAHMMMYDEQAARSIGEARFEPESDDGVANGAAECTGGENGQQR